MGPCAAVVISPSNRCQALEKTKEVVVWLRILNLCELVLPQVGMQGLPRPFRVPKRFDENSARRGVGSFGLRELSTTVLRYVSECSGLPLVNVEVLRQVCGKASRWRRASNGF